MLIRKKASKSITLVVASRLLVVTASTCAISLLLEKAILLEVSLMHVLKILSSSLSLILFANV